MRKCAIGVNLMDIILITGGAGFIGSTLANYLGKENKIVVVDDLSMGKKKTWIWRNK